MKYNIAWSGGKDSTASIFLALEHGIEINEIITVDIMYDDTHSATPLIDEFKNDCIKRFTDMGLKCTRLKPKMTYKDYFLSEYCRGKYKGLKHGQVIQGLCRFTDFKKTAIDKYSTLPRILGIAIDEPARLQRIKHPDFSILAKLNYTENDAMKLCYEKKMVSPLYKLGMKRDGCFFCPNGWKSDLLLIKTYMPWLYYDFKSLVYDNFDLISSNHYNRYMTFDNVFNFVDNCDTLPLTPTDKDLIYAYREKINRK